MAERWRYVGRRHWSRDHMPPAGMDLWGISVPHVDGPSEIVWTKTSEQAHRIVRAVNCYDELLEAARRLLLATRKRGNALYLVEMATTELQMVDGKGKLALAEVECESAGGELAGHLNSLGLWNGRDYSHDDAR